MNGPRFTEERLRNYLDTNQPMREGMCLALLPILGPYTREQPRRPKGGPDGGRDIEAMYQGQTKVWGAVGFMNGGGSDDASRDAAEKKFKVDLGRSMEENPTLIGFVFFTNVDLTPSRKEALAQYAQRMNIRIVDIFDLQRLRHALDSPEGLITRLQYLDIAMSNTEQASLVSKFGSQLQNAITARFDRVERTLAQMESFLDFQKTILRFDLYMTLRHSTTSDTIGDQAVLMQIGGLQDLGKICSFFISNHRDHRFSGITITVAGYMWNNENPGDISSLPVPISGHNNIISSFNEL